MIKSMTAFARRQLDTVDGVVSWEIKSLNHRYQEVFLRLPDNIKPLEMKLRERILKKVARGKLEVICNYQHKQQTGSEIKLNLARVQAVMNACGEIEALAGGVGQAVNALEILNYPGVVEERAQNILPDQQTVMSAFDAAVDELLVNKAQEGERLKELVLDRAKQLRNYVQQIRKHLPQAKQSIRQKLEQKLTELDADLDNDRLQQELVYLAQKMDIDEELDRLVSHLVALQSAFESAGPVGRKLDFLMQEFNREANTIASKSADAETTNCAVEMKVLIEQMREQIQNIE